VKRGLKEEQEKSTIRVGEDKLGCAANYPSLTQFIRQSLIKQSLIKKYQSGLIRK
jgi:hypothetical protein